MSDPMKLPHLENLTDLANLLRSIDNSEASEMGFHMSYDYKWRNAAVEHPCGSACCIGGWVKLCNPNVRNRGLSGAAATLKKSIPIIEFHELCYPDEWSDAWDATPEQAARAVEILRDTGKCDWEAAMGDQS